MYLVMFVTYKFAFLILIHLSISSIACNSRTSVFRTKVLSVDIIPSAVCHLSSTNAVTDSHLTQPTTVCHTSQSSAVYHSSPSSTLPNPHTPKLPIKLTRLYITPQFTNPYVHPSVIAMDNTQYVVNESNTTYYPQSLSNLSPSKISQNVTNPNTYQSLITSRTTHSTNSQSLTGYYKDHLPITQTTFVDPYTSQPYRSPITMGWITRSEEWQGRITQAQSVTSFTQSQPISTVSYIQPSSTISYMQPTSTITYMQPSSTITYIQPSSTITYIQPTSTISYIQPTSTVSYIQPITASTQTQLITPITETQPITANQPITSVTRPPPMTLLTTMWGSRTGRHKTSQHLASPRTRTRVEDRVLPENQALSKSQVLLSSLSEVAGYQSSTRMDYVATLMLSVQTGRRGAIIPRTKNATLPSRLLSVPTSELRGVLKPQKAYKNVIHNSNSVPFGTLKSRESLESRTVYRKALGDFNLVPSVTLKSNSMKYLELGTIYKSTIDTPHLVTSLTLTSKGNLNQTSVDKNALTVCNTHFVTSLTLQSLIHRSLLKNTVGDYDSQSSLTSWGSFELRTIYKNTAANPDLVNFMISESRAVYSSTIDNLVIHTQARSYQYPPVKILLPTFRTREIELTSLASSTLHFPEPQTRISTLVNDILQDSFAPLTIIPNLPITGSKTNHSVSSNSHKSNKNISRDLIFSTSVTELSVPVPKTRVKTESTVLSEEKFIYIEKNMKDKNIKDIYNASVSDYEMYRTNLILVDLSTTKPPVVMLPEPCTRVLMLDNPETPVPSPDHLLLSTPESDYLFLSVIISSAYIQTPHHVTPTTALYMNSDPQVLLTQNTAIDQHPSTSFNLESSLRTTPELNLKNIDPSTPMTASVTYSFMV